MKVTETGNVAIGKESFYNAVTAKNAYLSAHMQEIGILIRIFSSV